MNNILVIGSGCREVAIIKKLLEDAIKSNTFLQIICIATCKNPYIVKHCQTHIVKDYNLYSLTNILSKLSNIEFAIIGPEAPLENGYSNVLELLKIPCIGPLKSHALIETSKSYAREIITSCRLVKNSPNYIFLNKNMFQKEVEERTKEIMKNKIVIKKDGLCGGKGVYVEGVDFEKHEAQTIIMNNIKNSDLLIEEKLEGQEFSLMSITDGNGNVQHFPPICDYKRLDNNDKGPNTGSMGCFIDKNNSLPFLTQNDIKTSQTINQIIIRTLNKKEVQGYKGILYGSFMKSNNGKINIIEFNSRFGDPEGVLALSLLESNFYNICKEVAKGELQTQLTFSKDAAIGVYMVPQSYPEKTEEKYDIYFKNNKLENIYFGNVEKEKTHYYSLSSRTLLCVAKESTLASCFKRVYNDVNSICGHLKYRNDIAANYLSKYEQAGVSIDEGNNALKEMKKHIVKTYNKNVLGKYGDFGGQYKLGEYNLVSSIDGVGTKSILASKIYGAESFVDLGKDIVNHSVNDILVQGAFPLFFLDYYGTSHLKVEEVTNFVKGLSEACIENGQIPLIGGETAEMPSIYIEGKTDLVGCIIGLKDERFFQNTKISSGDILIGIQSVSPHTNGYSLINKIFDENGLPDEELVKTLLKPHKSYLNEINQFISDFGFDAIKGMCHITGGGLQENLSRVIPNELHIEFNWDTLTNVLPEWCKYLQEKGNIPNEELYRVFNCGVGFVLIISKKMENNKIFKSIMHKYIRVGEIV
jgi:phosphoribosylamine--glycine ligase/phosphoribosylaminoimidazole synthetase